MTSTTTGCSFSFPRSKNSPIPAHPEVEIRAITELDEELLRTPGGGLDAFFKTGLTAGHRLAGAWGGAPCMDWYGLKDGARDGDCCGCPGLLLLLLHPTDRRGERCTVLRGVVLVAIGRHGGHGGGVEPQQTAKPTRSKPNERPSNSKFLGSAKEYLKVAESTLVLKIFVNFKSGSEVESSLVSRDSSLVFFTFDKIEITKQKMNES